MRDKASAYPDQLSGGQQQQMCIRDRTKAVDDLNADGTIKKLQDKWLAEYTKIGRAHV